VLAMVLVAWRFDDLRRWAPPVVPRGRLLGALAAAALMVLAGLAVVLPIRVSRTNGGDAGKAQALVASADQLVTAGRFADAKGLLFQAQQLDSHPKGIDDVRAHMVVAQVQAALADQNRKDGIYDQAQRAAAAKQYARAIKLGRSIRGFRDIDQLVRAYRAAERRQAVGG
jgi:thioredoxin-like negative regulator of GroEL